MSLAGNRQWYKSVCMRVVFMTTGYKYCYVIYINIEVTKENGV